MRGEVINVEKLTLTAGSKGKALTLDIIIPTTLEEYFRRGYTSVAIEAMLKADLTRKLASLMRQHLRSDSPADRDALQRQLTDYVYVPTRQTNTSPKNLASLVEEIKRAIAEL